MPDMPLSYHVEKQYVIKGGVLFETPSITILAEKTLQFANFCISYALIILQITSNVLFITTKAGTLNTVFLL